MLHERTLKPPNSERGSRFWVAAELLDTTWFLLETCVNVSGRNEIRQWVTPSINRAVEIKNSMEPCQWCHIFVCLRAPLSIQNGTIFEVVREAYQAGARDSYVYILQNGMSFSAGTESPQGTSDEPQKLKLIYAKAG